MRYEKPALNFNDQAVLLLSRGLVADKADLVSYLSQVNYYRLSGYLYPFKKQGEENFIDGTTLHAIQDRYLLDKKLRLLILDAIEKLEIALLRSRLVEYLAVKYGAFCFVEMNNFKPKEHFPTSFHEDLLKLSREILASDTDFINRYRVKYSEEEHLPFWMLVEKMTMGNLSVFFGNLHRDDRKQLARQFGLPYGVFASWVHSITFARNLCAHHERLWNRYLQIRPKIPDVKNVPEFHTPVKVSEYRSKIFVTLVVIQFLLNHIDPSNDWGARLGRLIEDYQHLPVRKLGFPENWRQLSFFGLS